MSTTRKTPRGRSLPSQRDKRVAREAIARYLHSLDEVREHGGQSGPRPMWHQPRPDQWTIGVVGSAQQTINVELSLGEYTLRLMSFFMRAPDENVSDVHRLLLRRDLEVPAVKFGIDEFGDIYLRADLPVCGVTETELDRVVGVFYSCSDGNYLPVMRLGFASALKEQARRGG